MFKYFLCGVRIISDKELVFSAPVNFTGDADIVVRDINELPFRDILDYSLSPYTSLLGLHIYNTKESFYVLDYVRNKIIFFIWKKETTIYCDYNKRYHELFLLIIYNWMEQYIYIHSAGFEIQGRAYGIMAPSGTGKSSTLLGILERGYAYISDDQLPIRYMNNAFYAYPSSSIMPKCLEDTLRHFHYDRVNDLKVPGTDFKYFLPMDKINKCNRELPLDTVFLLKPNNNTKEITYRKIGYIPDLYTDTCLQQDINNYLSAGNRIRRIIESISNFVQYIDIYEISYQKKFCNLSRLIDCILVLTH